MRSERGCFVRSVLAIRFLLLLFCSAVLSNHFLSSADLFFIPCCGCWGRCIEHKCCWSFILFGVVVFIWVGDWLHICWSHIYVFLINVGLCCMKPFGVSNTEFSYLKKNKTLFKSPWSIYIQENLRTSVVLCQTNITIGCWAYTYQLCFYLAELCTLGDKAI